ncbi:MAPEG family protein [Erythrobacter sp. R86502]|uniref:MAPEG family protein n=1 Tax=Erythrobacter sp. R86502 TaxID=3093846 RepID=UPI0036D2FC63
MLVLPVTLAAAAAATVLNIWLMLRVGAVRRALGISVGDGGSDALQRRMRAQLNYVENTAFVLILIGVIELSGRGSWWLSVVAAVYFLGRLLHGFGMDGGNLGWARVIGIITTMFTQLALAVVAAMVAAGVL